MNISEHSQIGFDLAKDLKIMSLTYDIRSDNRAILNQEALTIDEIAFDFFHKRCVEKNFNSSVLFSEWGESLIVKIPEISERVKVYYVQSEQFSNT